MSSSKLNPLKLLFRHYCTAKFPAVGMRIVRDRKKFSESMLLNHLVNRMIIDAEKWGKIRDELLTMERSITPTNVDSIIVDTCCCNANHDAALNYVDYLRRNHHKLNVGTIGKWMTVLAKKEQLSEKEENDVIEIYDNLRKDYPLLDPITAGSCMQVLCKTKRWRDACDLKKMMNELNRTANPAALNALISAAFDNNEEELGWEVMRELVWTKGILSKKVYTSYLNYSLRIGGNKEKVEEYIGKLLEFLGQWDLYPWVSTMKEYAKVMEEFGWKGDQTEIKRSGTCKNCKEPLSELKLTEEEFNYLSTKFMERAVVGSDVYNRTTPKELNNFKTFIERAKPYDIVIDGLNVEYTLSGNRTTTAVGSKLAQLVKFLLLQDKKIVVLGRKHMMRWQREHMLYIQKHTKVFFAENTSADDPYLLYATLAGGQDTYFVSKDLMRQHKFVLDDVELIRIFKLWQLSRQIQPQVQGARRSQMAFLDYPPSYVPIAQKNWNNWHIPCIENSVMRQSQLYNLSQPWYCLRKYPHEKSPEKSTQE